MLNLSPTGVTDLLSGFEDRSSLAVRNDSALEEGYANIGGRSSGVLEEPLVLGGLGSGVGGLRAFTGVLRDDCFDMRELTTLSAWGGGSTFRAGCPSCAMVGGVGGRPLSAPNATGGESGDEE